MGVTSRLDYRLGQHEFGHDRRAYTFSRRPLVLVHVSDFVHVDQAIRWEKQLKGWSRAKKLALVRSDWQRIRQLAVAYFRRRAPSSPFDGAQGDSVGAQGDSVGAQGDSEGVADGAGLGDGDASEPGSGRPPGPRPPPKPLGPLTR